MVLIVADSTVINGYIIDSPDVQLIAVLDGAVAQIAVAIGIVDIVIVTAGIMRDH